MSFKKKMFDIAYEKMAECSARIFTTIAWAEIDEFQCNPNIGRFANAINGINVLTLNISLNSCKITSHDDGLFFEGRFGGKLESEFFPWRLVQAVYNPDNSKEGIVLPAGFPEGDVPEEPVKEEKKRPTFGVIEGGKGGKLH